MYLADYHMHSKYSFDGSEELDTICQTAIRRGLSEIAITDHMDIYTGLPYDEQMNFEVPAVNSIIWMFQGCMPDLFR